MKRKYLLGILILVFICVIGVFVLADHISYTATTKITNYPSEGENIIAFGDSLTYGLGATKGNNYVHILSRKLGLPIVNKGVMGDTTAQALSRIDDVLVDSPKVVIVYLGGNDVLQGVPADTTFENLSKIIQTIHREGAVVVLVGVRAGIFNDPYKERFEALAKRYQTAYVPDMMVNILGKEELLSDPIHPNDRGYEIVAEAIYKILQTVVK